MYLIKCQKLCYPIVVMMWVFFSNSVFALEFEVGVGASFEYTDNATLTSGIANPVLSDLIAITSVESSVAEVEGPLVYSGVIAFQKENYTRDSFEDQHYFNLTLNADWELMKKRLTLRLTDTFGQRSISSVDTNTPDNTQDNNVFGLAAEVILPTSSAHSFVIIPAFRQYYYEDVEGATRNNNNQYELIANWDYKLFRLMDVGLRLSTRVVDYTEMIQDLEIPDTTFSGLSLVVNGKRSSSNYIIDLGVTTVKKDVGTGSTGFDGGISWDMDVSSRSTFNAVVRSDITDTSSASSIGTGDDVEIVSDVVRNSIALMSYKRKDAELDTELWAEYRKLKYDVAQLNQVTRTTGARLTLPGTPLLSSSISVKYRQTERLDDNRVDDTFIVGGDFDYSLSRLLSSVFSIRYSTKESTFGQESYNELSVLFNLTYGYGSSHRSLRGENF